MGGDGRGPFVGLTLSVMVVVGVALVFCAAALIVGRSLYTRSAGARVPTTMVTPLGTPSETSIRLAESSLTPSPSRTAPSTSTATVLEANSARTVAPSSTGTRRAAGTLSEDSNLATATATASATPTPALADTVTFTPVPDGTLTPSVTASATLEPTATATPVAPAVLPTGTPTPSVTPLSPGWYVQGETASLDSDGDVHVIGEVLNNTGANQENVVVVFTFYDDRGERAGEAEAWPVVNVLPHGVTVPFEAAERLRTGYVRYEFAVTADSSSQQARRDLKLISHSGAPGDPYVIMGEVGNPGPDLPEFGCAWIIGTLYDRGGKVLGAGYGGVKAPQLRSGQMSTFRVEVSIHDPLPGAARYGLVVLGFSDCG